MTPSTSSRSTAPLAGFLTVALLSAACGGPVAPTPPVTPPPPNAAPVVKSVVVSQSVIEVNQTVQVTATVEDAETAIEKLQFVWSSAPPGSFIGEGPSVTWRPSETMATPADPALTVTVVESYSGLDAQGRIVTLEHRVSGSASVRVHNSERELGDMGLAFLEKFADSSVSPEACVVDFFDGCPGKADEIGDIRFNREHYVILSHTPGTPRFTSKRLYKDADMLMACAFESRVIKCPTSSPCVVGTIERVSGDCRLTGVYEQSRWWLCVSNFVGSSSLTPAMRNFFGADVKR